MSTISHAPSSATELINEIKTVLQSFHHVHAGLNSEWERSRPGASGQQAPCVPLLPNARRQFIAETLLEMHAWQLTSNDILDLPNGLEGRTAFANRLLLVNGRGPVKLTPKELLVLRILINYRVGLAAEGRRLRSPENGGYLGMTDLLGRIKLILPQLVAEKLLPSGEWHDPNDLDIRRVISSLRKKLHALGGNSRTIQSGKRGLGYRINTPLQNLRGADADNPAPADDDPDESTEP